MRDNKKNESELSSTEDITCDDSLITPCMIGDDIDVRSLFPNDASVQSRFPNCKNNNYPNKNVSHGDSKLGWMKPTPVKVWFEDEFYEMPEKLLKAENPSQNEDQPLESTYFSSNSAGEQSNYYLEDERNYYNSTPGKEFQFDSYNESYVDDDEYDDDIVLSDSTFQTYSPQKFTELKVIPIYLDEKKKPCQKPKKQNIQLYISNLNDKVNDIREVNCPFVDTVQFISNARKRIKEYPPRVAPRKYPEISEFEKTKRLRNYKVDNVAVGNINKAYFHLKHFPQCSIKPYNALKDEGCHNHFKHKSVLKVLYRNGLLRKNEPEYRGEAMENKHAELLYETAAFNDYLYRRNLHGLGCSDEQFLGHTDYMSKMLKGSIVGPNGEEGYRKNTPTVRDRPCIGRKDLPALIDSHCVIAASVYNSHPLATRNWIKNDYKKEFVAESRKRHSFSTIANSILIE